MSGSGDRKRKQLEQSRPIDYDINDEELIGEKNDSRSAIGGAAEALAKVKMVAETPLIYFDKLKAGSRVLVADSKGIWRATILKVGKRKKEQGFVIRCDGIKKSSEIWMPRDRVVRVFIENRRKLLGEEAGITLIDFNTLGPGSRVIVAVDEEAWKATITSPMEQGGHKGFMVHYHYEHENEQTNDTSEESDHVWIRLDRVLDVIIQDTKEMVNVAKVAKDSGKQVEFSRLGVGSPVFVLGEEGQCPAHVKECCLQGFMVNYELPGDDELSSCWVAWNRIANVSHDDFEKKVKVANDMKDKILLLLMKNEYAGASEVYNKACDEEGKPPKLWAAEVAFYVRRHIKVDDEVDIYFPNLPPRPSEQEYTKSV